LQVGLPEETGHRYDNANGQARLGNICPYSPTSSGASFRKGSAPAFQGRAERANASAGLSIKEALRLRIVAALRAPGRTEGVRKIAQKIGVNPSTVQAISREIMVG